MEHMAVSGNIFGSWLVGEGGGAPGTWWLKAEDAADHATGQRKSPITTNYWTQGLKTLH